MYCIILIGGVDVVAAAVVGVVGRIDEDDDVTSVVGDGTGFLVAVEGAVTQNAYFTIHNTHIGRN